MTDEQGRRPRAWVDRYLWVVRLDAEGRCTEFTEWWMQHPTPARHEPQPLAWSAMSFRRAASTLGASSPNSSMLVPWPPPGMTSSRLSLAGAARYMVRASSTNGWSSAPATNSAGTRNREIAAPASTSWNDAGP